MSKLIELPTTNELTTSCAQYLHHRFNYDTRMAEITEQLSMAPDELDAALVAFMGNDILTLRLVIEKAAMAICARSAEKLVKSKGDGWREFYEEVDCD